MVNKIVFDYLSQYHGKYNLEDLKKKILSAGYSQQDVDEALKLLGLEGNIQQTLQSNTPINNGIEVVDLSKPSQVNYDNYKPSGKKFKWMKFAGILGVLYFLTGILFSIITYVYRDSLSGNTSFSYVFLGIALLLFISIFFYLYGFVRMGKYTNSGLLRFASKSMIVLIILGILLIIGGVVGLIYLFGSFSTILTGNAIDSIDLGAIPSIDAQNIFANLMALGAYIYLIAGIFSLFGLFAFIVIFCFFIGLIQAGSEVRFAKPAGVLGILNLIIFFVLSLALAGIMAFALEMINGTLIPLIFIGISGILGLFGFLIYLFMILALFNASRKFESGYV